LISSLFCFRRWFILPSTKILESLHETIIKTVNNFYSHTYNNYDNYWFSLFKRNRQVHRTSNRSKLHYSFYNSWRDYSSFFIRWLDSHEEQQKERKLQIKQHDITLVSAYAEYTQKVVAAANSSWEEFISAFRYRREILQHLRTGYQDIFEISNEMERYGETFNRIEYVFHGIELETKVLEGVCDQCIHLYSAKNIRKLKPLLQEYQNT
jgi:hypothetical protein